MAPPAPKPRSPFLVPVAVAALALGGLGGWAVWKRQRAEEAWRAEASRRFAPVLEALEAGAADRDPAAGYDIDQTVRVVHEMDLALSDSVDMADWLRGIAQHDLRGVAPPVLIARRRLMDVLYRIYAVETEQEERRASWSVTRELLVTSLSVVQIEADLNPVVPSGSVKVDREQARALLEELREREEERAALSAEFRALEAELLDVLVDYSEVFHRTVEEWERLCTVRDRAYLAVHAEDWDAAIAAAQEAIAMAPDEQEAHLLHALALIESARADGEGGARVARLLGDYVAAHPDHSAPALLLLGRLKARGGDVEGARLDLQQAAAYYPRQAEHLTDMLDPYRMRGYLRRTREGGWVRDQYRATMLGAGYFSPDLQLARLHFEQGDFEAGRSKVLDHFSRRRAQRQWDLVLADIQLCVELLGEDYRRIFPEDAWLDLTLDEALFGSKLTLSVDNRSDRALHNATLVLALHLTDMHVDDYETLVAGETAPVLGPHAATSFGTTEITLPVDGVVKTVDDIVAARAILVSNEAVVWVDTTEFKAEVAASRRAGARAGGGAAGRAARLARQAQLTAQRGIVSHSVAVTLPRELALLRPVFRLDQGAGAQPPREDRIEGASIVLRFGGVDLEAPFVMTADTLAGRVTWRWTPAGGGYRMTVTGP